MGKQWIPVVGAGFLIFSAWALPVSGEGAMNLSSPEFKNNQPIPERFTCEGADINPTLVVEGIPDTARSLALIVDDPDAPMGTWVHWVIFNIPPTSRINEDRVDGTQGRNDSGGIKYHGPCPPSGTHRYFFKIYALDALLDLKEGVSKDELAQAMEGHVLDKAELIGLYGK